LLKHLSPYSLPTSSSASSPSANPR
jgi:hypothetical protein